MILKLATAALRLLPAEAAHDAAIMAARATPRWAIPKSRAEPLTLGVELAGLKLANPIGLAAGLDKQALAPDFFLGVGFGFVEIGTVTPQAQPGNAKPRLFRLAPDRAIVNRFGFNSHGAEAVAARLAARRGREGLVGVNLGANKASGDKASDYIAGLRRFQGLADYFAINISSPNTPGLRGLQDRGALEDLLARISETRSALGGDGPEAPVFLKVAPDLDAQAVEAIADVAGASGTVDALIISNTTVARPASLASKNAGETGGLSGRPLFEPSTQILKLFRQATAGRIPLIGVGGVEDGATAYAKIRAGASAVQVYTALIYEGPGLAGRIKIELAALLATDGFATIADAVGADVPV